MEGLNELHVRGFCEMRHHPHREHLFAEGSWLPAPTLRVGAGLEDGPNEGPPVSAAFAPSILPESGAF